MSNYITPRDVLIGIGYNLPENRRGFIYGENRFHGFMFARRERFPGIFSVFMFDTNGHYPLCEELTEAFNSLKLSGVIHSPPTMARYYQFDPCVKACYEGVKFRMNTQQEEELTVITQEFEREFGENNRFSLYK